MIVSHSMRVIQYKLLVVVQYSSKFIVIASSLNLYLLLLALLSLILAEFSVPIYMWPTL